MGISNAQLRKQKKKKQRAKDKKLEKQNRKNPFEVSQEDKDFGRFQIYLILVISAVAAGLIVYAFS